MLKLLLPCLFLVSLIFGQEMDGGDINKIMKHPLTDMPAPAEDVQTTYYFPDFPDLKLPIGEVVTALCHFTNTGKSNYNVSAIMGSLNAPFDFRHHYQNYSYKPFGIVIKPGEEVTMKYNFQLHPDLEPVDYQLAVTVFYDSENTGSEYTDSYSNTFFNQTVELYQPNSEYDIHVVSSVLCSLLATTFVSLVCMVVCFPESKFVHKLLKTIKSGTGKASDGEDWTDEAGARKKEKRSKN